jgi:hypothetical protein
MLGMGPGILLAALTTNIVGHVIEHLHYWAIRQQVIFSGMSFPLGRR